jgi:hypothetical protein
VLCVGVFDSAPLIVKEPNGNFRPEHEWNSKGGKEQDCKVQGSYSDGSIENDLPMQQLSELFNVNHFVVSQVNFHSALLSSVSMRAARQDSLFSSALLYGIVGYVRFLKAQMKDWLKNLVVFFNHSLQGAAPTWSRSLARLVTQDYEGRELDVTIMPWANHIGLLRAGLSVIKNPTIEEYHEVVRAAEQNTFPFVPRIRAHCDIEMTLDRCVQRLRRKVAEGEEESVANTEENKNKLGHKRIVNRSDRTPSFYTSRSIVNLSGLSVADPIPFVPVKYVEESPVSARQQQLAKSSTNSTPTGSGDGTKRSSSASKFTFPSVSEQAQTQSHTQAHAPAQASQQHLPPPPPTPPSGTGSPATPKSMRKIFGSFHELNEASKTDSDSKEAAGNSTAAAVPSNNEDTSAYSNGNNNQPKSRSGSLDFQIGSSVSLEGMGGAEDDEYAQYQQISPRAGSMDYSEQRPSQDGDTQQTGGKITK